MSIHTRTTARGKVYDVRLRAPNGREISRTFRTKREALEYEARQIAAKGRGIWIDPRGSPVMFRDLAEEWLDCNPAKRQSTRARDESALRVHVYPALGSRKIGTLTPTDIRKLVSEWSETMAPRTVRRVYGALRACFNYAVESELLSRTPCRGIRLPAVEPTVSRIPAGPRSCGSGGSDAAAVRRNGVVGRCPWASVGRSRRSPCETGGSIAANRHNRRAGLQGCRWYRNDRPSQIRRREENDFDSD